MRIRRVTIRGFRGFNQEQEILLDSDVVLIYGLNGSGKSSFTEALEWLFFGEISRHRLSACRGEYQYEEYLRNLFYTGTEVPFVEVEGTVGDQTYIARKELLTEKNSRYLINGEEKDDFSSLPVGLESYSRSILAQTEIAALVNTEQKDRWEQLAYILGQDDLVRLRENFIALRNAKRDKEFESDWKSISRELKQWAELNTLRSYWDSLDTENAFSELENLLQAEEIEVPQGELDKVLRTRIHHLLGADLATRALELDGGDPRLLDQKHGKLKELVREVGTLSEAISAATVDEDELKFFRGGLQRASIPTCPFCLERTLTSSRMKQIEERLAEGKESLRTVDRLKEVRLALSGELRSISDNVSRYLPNRQQLKLLAQKLSDGGFSDLAAGVQEFEKSLGPFCQENLKLLRLAVSGCESSLEKFYFHEERELSAEEALRSFEATLKTMHESFEANGQKWDSIRDSILRKFPTGKPSQKELEKWLLLQRLHRITVNNQSAFLTAKLIGLITGLQEKLETFEKKEVGGLLSLHSDEIRGYYRKLNPGEDIQFKKIQVRPTKQRQAKLVAEAYGKEINPVTIFSEAHTNSLSLSIYFPQRVDRNDTWQVFVLDDPVQSMDQGHAMSLIDILADKAKQKQIILLTHSKEFADSFRYRFSPEVLLHYEFVDGGSSGPRIELRKGKTLDYLQFAEKNRSGTEVERKSAGNALRSAIEGLLGEFLLKQGMPLKKLSKLARRTQELFDQMEGHVTNGAFSQDDLNRLRMLFAPATAASHAWDIKDITPAGLSFCINAVRETYEKYIGPSD